MSAKTPKLKVVKKAAKAKVKRGKQKFRFELSPSKIPIHYKELWESEDFLMGELTTGSITQSTLPLDSYFSSFTYLYSCDYLWLDYSSYIYHIYETRSLTCYLDVCDLNVPKYLKYIELLYQDLLNYYQSFLKVLSRNINKNKLLNTCEWFIYHINRANTNDCLGLKLSLTRQNYSKFQYNDKVSGSVVKNLVSMLEANDNIYVFKGYSLSDNIHKGKNGNKIYSGVTKRANTLLLFRGKGISKYYHPSPLTNDETKKGRVIPEPKALVEVRVESKSKLLIKSEEYPVDWTDKLKESEHVMNELYETLKGSVVSVGGFEIPELIFRRIWIGSLDNYGRVHDNGSFQTKSKEMRKTILIDGEPTKTVDLSSLHPRLLYSMEGIELPYDFDPYPELNIKVDSKRIAKYKKFYELDEYNPLRGLAKISLLILINSSSRVEAKNAIKNKLEKDYRKGMTCQERYMDFIGIPDNLNIDDIIDQLMEHNKPISKYFASGVSGMLMNKDSDIIVETISGLVSKSIAVLPLHDSVTIREDKLDEAIIALECGYRKVTGSLINFKYSVE